MEAKRTRYLPPKRCTALIVAEKKARYRAKPGWRRDEVNTGTNNKLCQCPPGDNNDSSPLQALI